MTEQQRSHRRMVVSVALVSTALIAYEIVLMRRLLIEHWHHFGYLVISAALLGFGASGTLLAVFERRVRRRSDATLWLFALGLSISLVLLPRAATLLPITARFIPADFWDQIGWWSLYWLAAAVPFLLGAAHIGTAIMTAGRRVGAVYGVNLFGSGVGAVAGGLLVSRLPVEYAGWPSVGLALLGMGVLSLPAGFEPRTVKRWTRLGITLAAAGVAIGIEALRPVQLNPDEFKYMAYVRRLAEQGSAERIARAADPHGYVEVYESPLFHDLPFLALSERPPPMLSLLINGDMAGSALCINDITQARVMDTTLMALPYRLLREHPHVLLIGETGGANLWLARRRGAGRITVVQPNAALVNLLRETLAERVGHVLDAPGVAVVIDDPRATLESDPRLKHDLIQIVSLEGLGVGATGVRGLAEDHLVTVEGIATCLQSLQPGGVLSVCRGVQYPERENVRILATFAAALESIGITDADRHIVQVRDYLGVCTLALRAPLNDAARARLTAAIDAFNLTPVWYEGLPPERVNRPDQLAGPPGSDVDWLHHAAGEIFSPRREAFYEAWLTNVRPPRDDSPFFWDFYKPGAVAVLRNAYQDLWLTRAELGRLFLYASLVIAGAAAILLILAPLAVTRLVQRRRQPRRIPGSADPHAQSGRTVASSEADPSQAAWSRPPTIAMILYFAAIGVGFMGIEMALISRAIHWLGDPVIASALIIGALLVLSGLGSLVSLRAFRRGAWAPATLVATLTMFVAAAAFLAHQYSVLSGVASLAIAVVAIPLALVMGTPLPTGIARLADRAAALVPWAWGVNGVASVIGTSLAMVIAMSLGYRYVFALAAVLYACAALAALRLANTSGLTRRVSGPQSIRRP